MDSHGEQWSNVFIPYSIKQKYVLVQIYFKDYFICQKEYEKLNSFFSKYNSIKYIIIAHSVHCIHNHPILFKNYIKYLLNFTKCIYIIQENPKFLFNPTQFIYSKNNIKSYGVIGVNATFNKIPIILDEKVHYIDMNKYLCENNKCYLIINNIPVYKDEGHLSFQITKSLEEEFLINFKLDYCFRTNYARNQMHCSSEFRCNLKDVINKKLYI